MEHLKTSVYRALLEALHEHLSLASAASRDAADYATNEEARAESQWDTQGLEASYLAAGQAHHALEIANAIELLQDLESELLASKSEVQAGALITVESQGFRDRYFLVPAGGGQTVRIGDDHEVTTLTLQSPLGRVLLGKVAGTDYQLPNGMTGRLTEVV